MLLRTTPSPKLFILPMNKKNASGIRIIVVLTVVVSLIILFRSVINNQLIRSKKEKVTFEILQNLAGNKLYLPGIDTLNVLNDLKYNHYLVIVSFIDGNCGVCIWDLSEWKRLIDDFKRYKDLSYLFYVNSIDYDSFLNYEKREINFPLPLINDEENAFIKKNKLSSNKLYQTFLIDENNKVILVGNPLLSKEIKKLYQEEIQKCQNKIH